MSSWRYADGVAALVLGTIAVAAPEDEAPSCETQRQCEAMWVAAQSALEVVTNMRLRLVGTDRLETFAPMRASAMGGVVTKVPRGEKGYELRLSLECYRAVRCDDLRADMHKLFNLMVATPGRSAAPAAASAALPSSAAQP